MATTYQQAYDDWARDPEAFWAEAARAIDWATPPATICDPAQSPGGRWFTGGRLNACHNAVDRHVDSGRGEQAALVHVSAMSGTETSLSFRELRDRVAALAGALRALGVVRGDRVVIYMPMVPEAVIAMLACARLGAIHSVVFGGFAARELAMRIDDAQPKAGARGLLRARARARGELQGAARSRARALQRQAGRGASYCSARSCARRWSPGTRPRLDLATVADLARRLRAGRRDRSALHPLYLGHHGQAEGRGARHRRLRSSRCAGRCSTCTAPSRARCTGRRRTSAGWSAIPTSSTGRCCAAAPPCCTRASPSARPMPRRSGASSSAPRASRCCSPRRPRSARSSARTRRARFLRAHDLAQPARAVPRRRARRPRHRAMGRGAAAAAGRRPLVADRDRLAHGGELPRHRGAAGQARQPDRQAVPGFDVVVLDPHGEPLPAGEQGALAVRLPLPPGSLPTLWNDEAGFRAPTSPAPRLLQHRRRWLRRRRRLRVRHGPHRRRHQRRRAPALHRASSRRCWPRTRRSPNAP
jgi:propionyl-CoA synthetase